MKKTLLALTTAAVSMGAIAASTTNTSMTSTSKSVFAGMMENTSASLATGIERENSDTTSAYLNISGTKKFSDKLSITAQLRSDTDNVTDTTVAPYKMIDPRIFINALNTEFSTGLGVITLAPQLRIQAHTQDNTSGELATFRLGATASMATSTANTVSLSAFTYDTLTDKTATSNDGALYFILGNSYAVNDTNSISLGWEHFLTTDQSANLMKSVRSDNDFTLTYANSSIKNVSIAPYISQDLGKGKALAANLLEVGIDASYSF